MSVAVLLLFACSSPPEVDDGEGVVDEVDEPDLEPVRVVERGEASFYGRRFEGHRTASGERYDGEAYTAAHRTLPFGTVLRVTSPDTGRSVRVVVTDRGPHAKGRVVDLSARAADDLGIVDDGVAWVELEVVGCEDRFGGC
jgi:rare lipoprotein A